MPEYLQVIAGQYRVTRHAGRETWYRACDGGGWTPVLLRSIPPDVAISLLGALDAARP